MMSARSFLALAAAALLATCVAGALPAEPFANEGGPEFMDGATYSLGKDGKVAAMGIIADDGYVSAGVVNGTLLAERAVYSSWECDAENPGFYKALLKKTVTDASGAVVEEVELCEYGTVTETENKWAQSADECPTETDTVDIFLNGPDAPARDVANACA